MRVLSEGSRLAGRYTLVRRYGSGGMAEIWLAQDKQSDKVVALKFLKAEFAGQAAARDRLHKEWRIGSRLMHAHIVRVFEFHDDPAGAFFSLQAIDGPDISTLASTGAENVLGPLGLVADALRYAHAKGVVHGDVKASNILLDANGAPYLIDFGVATLPAIDESSAGGSAVNASPQRQKGSRPETADDIFAFGVLICELINGAPPGAHRPVTLQSADGSRMPATIGDIVNRMLDEDASARPDAEEVLTALKAAGYSPRPAHVKHQARATPPVREAVESIQPVRYASRPTTTTAPQSLVQQKTGVSPQFVFGGLGLLLLLFLGVIFVLPPAGDGTQQPAQQTADETSDDPVDAAADEAQSDATAADDNADLLIDSPGTVEGDEAAGFNENVGEYSADRAGRILAATDEALGDLLSRLERLRFRAVDRWGGQPFLDALNVYKAGDEAYLNKNYAAALRQYREAIKMLDPFFDRIEPVFRETLAAARDAFARGDHFEAIRLYDLAVAITPGNAEAERGLARSRNLEAVMNLSEQGARHEADLELDAARLSFEKALELDSAWEPAIAGLARVQDAIREVTFNQRMTEGFDALVAGYYDSARAAFTAAKAIDPSSRQAADGLLQVDQEIRLQDIRRLEAQAAEQVDNERWEEAVQTYQSLLDIDGDLQFAKEGLAIANQRVALHETLAGYIEDPDALSADITMQKATRLLLDISRISPVGPRLDDQKEALSRLLKRAATPLDVQLVSDNMTDVAIYQVAKFGTFSRQDLQLRPGVYVAVGSRPGYRDVRVEFRVAPEIEMTPVVVQCEEPI
jgi:tetratricopeptide (TPR) repeat protein